MTKNNSEKTVVVMMMMMMVITIIIVIIISNYSILWKYFPYLKRLGVVKKKMKSNTHPKKQKYLAVAS